MIDDLIKSKKVPLSERVAVAVFSSFLENGLANTKKFSLEGGNKYSYFVDDKNKAIPMGFVMSEAGKAIEKMLKEKT